MRKHPVVLAGIAGILIGGSTFGGITAVHAAGSQPPQPVTVTNTASQAVPTVAQGTTQVAGSVTVSGLPSLPAGTNDVGTVHVASPARFASMTECNVQDGGDSCATVGTNTAATSVINTLSVHCLVAYGHRVDVYFYFTVNGFVPIYVPLTYQASFGGPIDVYSGTLTDLSVPGNRVGGQVSQDYHAASGNGTTCQFVFAGTA